MGDTVFINGRAAVHKGSAGIATLSPDVCLCPPTPPAGPVPTPLPNQVVAADLKDGASSVKVEGNPAGKQSSSFGKSTGNEVSRSTGGGVLSGTAQGKAFFVTGSFDVLIEGEPAVRHMDLITGNHGAKAPPNTPPGPFVSVAAPGGASARRRTSSEAGAEEERLVVAIQQSAQASWAGARYRLTAGGKSFEGRLAGAARVDHMIPKGTKEAKLEVFPPKGSGPAHVWTLKLEELPPCETLKGAQVRLTNLGYRCGEPNGAMDARTRVAIEGFQRAYGCAPSGRADEETMERLTVVHDANLPRPVPKSRVAEAFAAAVALAKKELGDGHLGDIERVEGYDREPLLVEDADEEDQA
jgi:hypothetical protein